MLNGSVNKIEFDEWRMNEIERKREEDGKSGWDWARKVKRAQTESNLKWNLYSTCVCHGYHHYHHYNRIAAALTHSQCRPNIGKITIGV